MNIFKDYNISNAPKADSRDLSFVRGLKVLGYGGLRGTQNFWRFFDDTATLVSRATGLNKGGIFEALAEMAEPPKDWAPRDLAEKIVSGLASAPPEIGLIAASPASSVLTMAAMGAIRGGATGGSRDAAREATKGALLGGILKGAGNIAKPFHAPTVGGVFGAQSLAEGGSPEDIAEAAAVGFGLGVVGGGKPRKIKPKNIIKENQPPDRLIDAYEYQKNKWFQGKDYREFEANVETRLLQKSIKQILGEKKYTDKAKNIDKAIQIHIDLKRNPDHLERYYNNLTNEQQQIVDLALNLPAEIRPVVEQIESGYKSLGLEGMDSGIIHNMLDNYAARIWKIKDKPSSEELRKFGTKTRHAKPRKFETILEGWANGFELDVEGATNNLNTFKKEFINTIENKKFLEELKKVKDPDGNPLISHRRLPGYDRVDHPNFTDWQWEANIKTEEIVRNMQRISESRTITEDVGGDTSSTQQAQLRRITRDALEARGFTPSEANQFVERIASSGGRNATERIIREVQRKLVKETIERKSGIKQTGGKNWFVNDRGDLFHRREFYAPKAQAKNLNNMLGTSSLNKIPGVHTITKYNAIAKSWILQSSFFHHLAFMRSYYLGTQGKKFSELSLRGAMREGMKAIESLDPELRIGVEEGLTLGLKQDWNERLLREKTFLGKVLDKTKASKTIKDKILNLRERQAEWLFGEMGASLKAKSFLVEFKNHLKKHPNEDPRLVARRVSKLINDDFGGLHLQRLGRNPTAQHIFRLFALAPDWTESNIRTMVKTIGKGGKAERQLYRRFWAGVIVKGLGATALANFALSGGDLDEMLEGYKRAWKSGNLKWLSVDVTPIYKLLGGEDSRRRYFELIGHFRDPLKFLVHPIRAMHHKGSVVYGIFHEVLAGADWKGERFTTVSELLKTGKTVKWGPGKPIELDQFPSYVLSQIMGLQPVQIQNLIAWLAGEVEGFEALGRSMGLQISKEYKPKQKKLKTLRGLD